MAGKFKLAVLAAMAVLPSPVTCLCYRLFFGYKIGKKVRIGFSIIDAKECEIGSGVFIGHLNAFVGIKKLSIGEYTRIGALNVFRGGDEMESSIRSDNALEADCAAAQCLPWCWPAAVPASGLAAVGP